MRNKCAAFVDEQWQTLKIMTLIYMFLLCSGCLFSRLSSHKDIMQRSWWQMTQWEPVLMVLWRKQSSFKGKQTGWQEDRMAGRHSERHETGECCTCLRTHLLRKASKASHLFFLSSLQHFVKSLWSLTHGNVSEKVGLRGVLSRL